MKEINITTKQWESILSLRKRFQYQYIFRHRPTDPILIDFRKRNNPLYEEESKQLHEFPISAYLDSYKEARKRFPIEMQAWYDFVRLQRTGKKVRSIKYLFEIRIWQLKRIFRKIKLW